MRYYIPTYLRAAHQRSYRPLEEAGLKPTLVVDETDPQDYNGYRHVRAPVQGIAAKRQWIQDHAGRHKHVMVDDDVEIRRRMMPENKLVPCGAIDLLHMDMLIQKMLERFAHGGLAMRFGSVWREEGYEVNSCSYRQVIFYNPRLFKARPQWELGWTCGSDTLVQLQLMRQGLSSLLITEYVVAEHRTKELLKGGMNAYISTEERNEEYAEFVQYFVPAHLIAHRPKFARKYIPRWRGLGAYWQCKPIE